MLRSRDLNNMSVIVPTYLFLALIGLNKIEAIYKLTFGISICGAALSYNNVKQLHIGHAKCTCIRHGPNTLEFAVLHRTWKIKVCTQKRPCKNIILLEVIDANPLCILGGVRSTRSPSTVVLNLVDADST